MRLLCAFVNRLEHVCGAHYRRGPRALVSTLECATGGRRRARAASHQAKTRLFTRMAFTSRLASCTSTLAVSQTVADSVIEHANSMAGGAGGTGTGRGIPQRFA